MSSTPKFYISWYSAQMQGSTHSAVTDDQTCASNAFLVVFVYNSGPKSLGCFWKSQAKVLSTTHSFKMPPPIVAVKSESSSEIFDTDSHARFSDYI